MKLAVLLLCLLASSLLARNYSVKTNLKDQLSWKLDSSTFDFSQDGTTCELKNGKGKLIYTWKEPLQVAGAVASENGTTLLVRVMTATGFYHGITRFVLVKGAWKMDEVMLDNHPDMAIRDRWVEELGAVADDGNTAIFHIGEADSDRTPEREGFRMFYTWQTWELNKTEMLGIGLKMSNGKRDNKS